MFDSNPMEEIDQKFFINPNEVEFWSRTDGYLYDLLFTECSVIDEKGNEYILPPLKEFYCLDEWKQFKIELFQKIEQLKKYTKLWVESLEKVQSATDSEEEARAYWDDLDDTDYYKEEYETFEDWYESSSYYQWAGEERDNDLSFINRDYPEFKDKIKLSMYYNDSYSGQYYWDTIEKRLDEMKEDSSSYIKSIDSQIEEAIEEHKYDAVIYALEEL